jgi:3-hydroxyacyl-CoA dehydrogenase
LSTQVTRTIGVVGAGTMGSTIAMAIVNAGRRAILVDSSAAALGRSRLYISSSYDSLRRRGRLDDEQITDQLARISSGTDLAAVSPCSVVIEAVYESQRLKAHIFAQLASICAPEAILATNTSTLDVDAIAAAATGPGRCLGMHFFSPAHIMKLVEVVRANRTTQRSIDAVCALARELGKTPVVVRNCDGFVGNRMLLRYRREAEFLVLEGAQPRDVDAALEAFGFAMGPFAVSDLVGIDIGVAAKREREARGAAPAFALTSLSDKLVAAGRLGKKTGRGYYRYDAGAGASDDVLESIVADERARLRIAPRAVPPTEIVERCILALVNEGGWILGDGIAASSEDIDTIWRLGYGFPSARGGPLHYAQTVGFAAVAERIEALAAGDPAFWNLAPYLRQQARGQA